MTAMAESRFDIQFAGELVQGADPLLVRERLRDLFKLSPDALERLFSSQAVIIKRDLDAVTAARYRDAFRDAGAILRLTQTPAAGLTLAPPGADLEEAAPAAARREIDTSYLSLVAGEGWTLEDCAPPHAPTPIPDISYLTLAPAEPIGFRAPNAIDE
jgi:hypothetical protein